LMLVVAAAGAWRPALRVIGIEPAAALRHE